jgi:cell division protein ZapA (FtsZ GTPase activity inhibitor)
MKNNYNQALLLYSILETENDNGAELEDLIAYADYVNHAIMTYDEFNEGINYLLKYKLVKEIDKRVFAEESFKEWFRNEYKSKKRIVLLSAVNKIQKYLEKVEKENDINKNIETKINEKDFENNVKEYIKIYNGIK